MSFRKNDNQQISFNDSTFGLTERERKALDHSWAKVFADDVFPYIDEDRFSVLYSDKASRPNTPVSDPDATYREKAGRQHRGYVANIEESVSENGSIVTDYQFEKNNVSDSQMLKDHISDIGNQDEQVTLAADGAYSGIENKELAAKFQH